MDSQTKALLRSAFDAYLQQRETSDFDPADGYLPYGLEDIDGVAWGTMAELLIEDELREITNGLNSWHNDLIRWHAWNAVCKTYSEEDAWEVIREFVEPLAHACMLLPSSTRDQLVFVATNAMHQVRIGIGNGYPFELIEDVAVDIELEGPWGIEYGGED